jgi:phenylpyruvate tautomerase PptA (4-oxalocrotonate tautomerase family)
MPLYRCAVREGLTSMEQREQIAKEVVRIHCDVTDAPPSFVHAFFAETPAAELPEGKAAFMLGSIRAGRTDAQKARIVSELTDAIATLTGLAPEEVGVATADVPSKWIMEGGELLPEPGEEAEWLVRHGRGGEAGAGS